MTGRLLISTRFHADVVRALSNIFYGIGPGIGLTVAIRPHLNGLPL
jgi:hypothetical protein